MMTEDAVDAFLEHHGVKGQRWGFRNSKVGGAFTKAEEGDWKTRSKGQKVGLVVGGLIGATAVSALVNNILAVTGHTGRVGPFGVANVLANTSGAIIGARLTRNLLQKSGKKKVKEIKDMVPVTKITNAEKHHKELTELDNLYRESKFKSAKEMGPDKTKRLNYLAKKHMA